jgi:hypothetical protein
MSDMLPINNVIAEMNNSGKGFTRIDHIAGTTYKDNSTIIIVPTRGSIHHRVVTSWLGLIPPMNQKRTPPQFVTPQTDARSMLFASGHEVGRAYDEMIKHVLANPELSKWKYILTLEDDNLPPPDAHIRLLESIEWGKFDAVGGLYFTKGEINMPMCYGDPDHFKKTGELEFRPRDIRSAIQSGNVVECNGIAMGCSLYRLDLFREIPAPWFVTVNDVVEGGGAQCFTQDLWFCQKAKQAGKRFAVDTRVKVGHLDVNTGEVY